MALAAKIEASAASLAQAALDKMYKDPFWDERFGERGRRFTAEDGRYHVLYLVEALGAHSPETLVRYARWLQTVLTSRGMCSKHLGDHFDRLASAIVEEGIEAPEEALQLLAAARDGLIYEAGPERELSLAGKDIAERATEILARRRGIPPPSKAHAPPRADDFDTLLSYLADAIALHKPQNFAVHLQWLAGFLERRGVPRADLTERLSCLEEAIAPLPPDALELARGALAGAEAALAEGSA